MATRDYSSLQEQHIAKKTGGKITSNSGGTRFGGGDILTEDFLIEAKTSMKPKTSFSIKKEWLDKAQEQAFEQGKAEGVLAFRFEPKGKDYYCISETMFMAFLELWEDKNGM